MAKCHCTLFFTCNNCKNKWRKPAKSQQGIDRSAARSAAAKKRRDTTSPHNDGIKSNRNPKRFK